jgi:hypothetical protein
MSDTANSIESSALDAPPAAIERATADADPVVTLKRDLDQARQTLTALKREREIQRALFAEGVGDLDIGTVLVERELASKPNTDVDAVVRDLKQRKPLLFLRPGGVEPVRPRFGASPKPSSTMGARPSSESPRDRAARAASTTNSRSSLLAYMRLKRQPA